MYLSRAIVTRVLSSYSRGSSKWLPVCQSPSAVLHLASLSSDAATPARRTYKRAAKTKPTDNPPELSPSPAAIDPPSDSTEALESLDLPRPCEIPFQPKVANQVHLIGSVGMPVQLQTLPNGSYTAVSILVQEKAEDLPKFWIPVNFQGHLAQIAACHLKENDVIYVTGQLCGETLSDAVENVRTNIQVLASSLSFVQPKYSGNLPVAAEKSSSTTLQLWNDLLANPHDWWDKRSEGFPKQAAFKHKVSGQLLQIDESTPESILSRLESLSFGGKSNDEYTLNPSEVKSSSTSLQFWNDLLANPHDWWDNRSKGSPKRAAFVHKVSGQLLRIDESTPEWILSRLKSLPFGGKSTGIKASNPMKMKSFENFWDDLIVNPHGWLDNRTKKLNGSINPRSPDFLHKETRKALWLDSAPSWVPTKLDSVFPQTSKNYEKSDSIPSKQKNNESLWKDLVENPKDWWDNRLNKFKPNAPDFKRKDSGEALWLGSTTPQWVLAKLPPINKERVDGGNASLSSARLFS